MRWLVVACLAGCSFEHGRLTSGGDGGVDPDPDAMHEGSDSMTMEMVDAQTCFGVTGVGLDFCLESPPSGIVTVATDATIDTDATGTDPLACRPIASGDDVCVIAASSITINATRTVNAHGARPLVFLASEIVVNGTIDVSSKVSGAKGPAADLPGCNGGTGPTVDGGSQGGSFDTTGGDGGDEDNANNSGGNAGATISGSVLRGGCPGAMANKAGGHGGGAVVLISDTLTLGPTSKINASGASGQGAGAGRHGGSGGGSGGMIVLSSTTISKDANAQIFANGGHGGGGSSSSNGTNGSDPTGPTSGGGGGAAGGSGGAGGPGYPATNRDGANGTNNGDGGGGGGGGAGVIHVYSSSSVTDPNVSPPPS